MSGPIPHSARLLLALHSLGLIEANQTWLPMLRFEFRRWPCTLRIIAEAAERDLDSYFYYEMLGGWGASFSYWFDKGRLADRVMVPMRDIATISTFSDFESDRSPEEELAAHLARVSGMDTVPTSETG